MVLPGGSTNVFARALGMHDDAVDAARTLLGVLDAGQAHRVGLARRATGDDWRRFVFHLGAGFDAAVIDRMEQRSYLKRHFAHPAFADRVGHLVARRRPGECDPRARRRRRGRRVGRGPYVVVSNADPYTYVGHRRMTISPHASLDDALAVTVLHHLRLALVGRAVSSAVGSGRFLASSPDVTQVGGVAALEISAPAPFPWQVDGDYLGTTDHLDVRHEPDCLSLVTP